MRNGGNGSVQSGLTCASKVLATMKRAANAPASGTLTLWMSFHIFGSRFKGLHVLAFNNVRNASAWILHDAFGGTVPNPLHLLRKRFGLTGAIEFQVDHHVVRVVLQAKDLIAANA